MFWAYEPYTVTAADLIPGTFVGRFWREVTRQWESCTNQNPNQGSGPAGKLRLRGIDMRVTSAAGGIRSGVRIWVFTCPDPMHPGLLIPVKEGFQGSSHLISWNGDFPLGGGIGWRICPGGVIATDLVHAVVGYE